METIELIGGKLDGMNLFVVAGRNAYLFPSINSRLLISSAEPGIFIWCYIRQNRTSYFRVSRICLN